MTTNEGGSGTVNASVTRIRSINSTHVELRVEEYEGYAGVDGVHKNETVGYLVVKPGTWNVGGKIWRVGTRSTDSSYSTMNFGYTFASQPAILTQINSYNEADAGSHTRQDNPTTSSSDVKVEEDSDAAHVAETIGFVAAETGVVNTTYTNGLLIQAGVTSDSVTDNWYTVTFNQYFVYTPVVVTKMMTENGGDEADESVQGVTKTTFQVSVEETPSHDGSHTTEIFGWIAGNEGLIYGRQYVATEPSYSVYSTEEILPNGSFIANRYETAFKGYLLMKVDKNTTNGWQTVDVVVNDTNTGTLRTVSGDHFDLSSIWNSTPWNTDKYGAGVYRVYIALTDAKGNVLQSDVGYIEGWDTFNITQPPVKINITEIRVYNVTGTPNTHIYINDLKGSGINTTFTLYTGNVYRIEIEVQNLPSSSVWNLTLVNVSHQNLNPVWEVDDVNDVWYSNISDRSDTNYVGGLWSSGIVEWNTSSLDGIVQPGGNVTFYYIVNITSNQEEDRAVKFLISDPNFDKYDISTFHIVVTENIPPFLYQEIYNVTSVNVTRGNSLTVYARWNETIGQALAEYNSTTSILSNYTITLPTPNPQNWTNYTIETTGLWQLGKHVVKIYASDEKDNWNGSLPYISFYVWGLARITDGSLNATMISVGESVKITCKVEDATVNEPITNYIVHFYNSTHELGTNITNSDGWTTFVYTDNSPGTETILCNITENAM